MAITYNVLNLQQTLSQSGTAVANYSWLADGTKCAVVDNTTNGFDYLGSLKYTRNGSTRTLESTDFGGGRVVYSGGVYNRYYYITDHLGSVRVITDNSGAVQERNDYYPFGGRHANSNYGQLSANKQKFNGKELQTSGFLDYGARMYDDVIGRWSVVDPMAEKYQGLSPFNYCANNPIKNIDFNGKDWYSYEEEYVDKNGDTQTRTHYKYVRGEMSKEYMKAGGYTHLGNTYINDNAYYSLGGAVLSYDKNSFADLGMVKDLMNADRTVIMSTNALNGADNFWKKYNNLISSGLDAANIIGTFMDVSSKFRGPVNSLGHITSTINFVQDAKKLFKGELHGVDLADAIVNVASNAGGVGAAISLNYNAAKAGASYLVKLDQFLRKFMYNSIIFRP